MRHILILLLLISTGATAQIRQDTTDARLLLYDTAIVVSLEPKFGLDRSATFKGFFYNLETQTLALRWRITYTKQGEPVSLFGKDYQDVEQIADRTTFVNMQGVQIDTTEYKGPFMYEIDFYKLIANRGTGANNATINQLIIQAGLKPGKWKE